MMTTISSTAQVAPTISPSFSNNIHPAQSEDRLDRIRRGEPMARVYRDESRSWWNRVDDDEVYKAIADDRFQSYVRLIVAAA